MLKKATIQTPRASKLFSSGGRVKEVGAKQIRGLKSFATPDSNDTHVGELWSHRRDRVGLPIHSNRAQVPSCLATERISKLCCLHQNRIVLALMFQHFITLGAAVIASIRIQEFRIQWIYIAEKWFRLFWGIFLSEPSLNMNIHCFILFYLTL